MTTADEIRRLAAEGMPTADIARTLGIRYQQARNALLRPPGVTTQRKSARGVAQPKPPLSVATLLGAGFVPAGRWLLGTDENIILEDVLPKDVGVYAFAQNGTVQYVGVATMGLAKRIYFYGRPGMTQTTSIRINGLVKAELLAQRGVDIFIAMPPDLEWGGLPVHGAAGLELGLIKKYSLPWNQRSAG
jgi:hypothetical protein